MVRKGDPVEDVLSGRQILKKQLGREVRLGERVREQDIVNCCEGVRGRHFDLHTGGTVGACPYDGFAIGNIPGLDTMRDQRSTGRPAEIGFPNAGVRKHCS